MITQYKLHIEKEHAGQMAVRKCSAQRESSIVGTQSPCTGHTYLSTLFTSRRTQYNNYSRYSRNPPRKTHSPSCLDPVQSYLKKVLPNMEVYKA